MTDIASLGFSIDTSEVRGAESDLDRLNATGAKTEAAAKGVGNAWSGVGSKVSGANGAIKSTSTAVQQGSAALQAQQAELSKLLGKLNPVVAALDRLDDQEQKLRKFKGKGLVDSETFNEYKTRIDQARVSLSAVDGTLRKTGISSAQTAQALRQLPAQFTDIFTSLAGGQSPLLVLIQQGGQIKDSFGGIGNTFDVLSAKVRGFFGATAASSAGITNGVADATALGSALSGVVDQQSAVAGGAQEASEGLTDLADSANASAEAAGNARTALSGVSASGLASVAWIAAGAAAAGALAYAFIDSEREAAAFNKTLFAGNRTLAVSAAQLQVMANQAGMLTGDLGAAKTAFIELGKASDLSITQLMNLGTAASAIAQVTGEDVASIAKSFGDLGDNATDAAQKVSDQYGLITAAQYDVIRALDENGDQQQALDQLSEDLNNNAQERLKEYRASLSDVERDWDDIKSAISNAYSEVRSELFPGASRELEIIERRIKFINDHPVASALFNVGSSRNEVLAELDKQRKALQDTITTQGDLAAQQGELNKANKDYISLSAQLSDRLSDVSPEAKKAKAIQELKEQFFELQRVSAITGKASPLLAGVNYDGQNFSGGAYDQLLAGTDSKKPKAPKTAPAFRDDAATQLLITLQKQEASLQEQLNSETKLTAEQKKRAEFEAEIAELKTKDILTADQQSLLANQDAIRAQLDQNVALADSVKLHQQIIVEQEKLAVSRKQLSDQLQLDNDNLALQVASVGLGKEEAGRQRDLLRTRQNAARQQRGYDDQFNSGDSSKELYAQQTADLKAALDERLALQLQSYEDLDAARGDWTKGYSSAMEDFLAEQRDIAGTTYDIVTNLLNGVTEGVSQSFANAIVQGDNLRDSLSNVAQTIETQLLASLIKLGIQYLINATIGESLAIATTAASVAQAQAVAAAWAPAEASVSLASFGTNAIAAAAGITSTHALTSKLALTGFKTGGYTGDGNPNEVAGVVHRGEFVVPADATSKIGIDRLQTLVTGREIATGSAQSSRAAASGGSGTASSTQVFNMSFPGITNEREAKRATAHAARQFAAVSSGARRYV